MIGEVRTEYLVFCDIDAPEATIEALADQLETSILQEEQLKELGIDINKLTEGWF